MLLGRCVDLGIGEAYTSVATALRPLIAHLGADAVAGLAGAAFPALQRLFPALGAPTATTADAGQLHEAIALLLEHAAQARPVILAIEDLHWIDAASLGVLRYVVRVLADSPVLVVGTFRGEDIGRGHPARALIEDLSRDAASTRIVVPRLDRGEIGLLASALLGTEPDAEALRARQDRTEGVPFYVEEFVELDACGNDAPVLPESLRELLLVRDARLSPDGQRVARHIALGGAEVPHELLIRVLADDAERVEPALREAAEAGIVLVTDRSYGFRHALVRECGARRCAAGRTGTAARSVRRGARGVAGARRADARGDRPPLDRRPGAPARAAGVDPCDACSAHGPRIRLGGAVWRAGAFAVAGRR